MIDGNINFVGSLSGSIEGGGGEGTNNYNELINKPSINNVSLVGNKTTSQLGLFDGNYTNLSNKPSINGTVLNGAQTSQTLGIFDGDYNNLINKPTIPSGDYDDLIDKPSINNVSLVGNRTANDLGLFDGDYDNLTNKPNLATVATTGSYDDLNNKPTIPAAQVNADWNASSGVAQILNKPTIPAAQVNADWNASSGVAEILNKPTIPAAQVNSDWNALSGVAQILNKPNLATVATSGSYNDLSNKPTANDISYDTDDNVGNALDTINSSLAQRELTYTGNTNSSGLIVTDIPFNSKIRHAYITQSDNTPIYCLLRPSSGGYVVALPVSDAFQKVGVLTNATVHVFVNG